MKRLTRFLFVIVLTITGVASGGDIVDTPWIGSNIASLRQFDRPAIQNLVDELRGSDPTKVQIGAFGWYDLARDGRYELLVTEDLSGRALYDYLAIYSRSNSGKVVLQQWIRGDGIGSDIAKIVRDVNSDGKAELIIPARLLSYSTAETYAWPSVYKLEDGKYVESSRDFPDFYDNEILPRLQKQIDYSGGGASGIPVVMERDKILRVLGRDPSAGLEQARQWMTSNDPRVLQAAAATFQDIGGHDKELRTATDAWKRASVRRGSDG